MLIAHLTKGKRRVEKAVSSVWRDEERPLSNFSSTVGSVQGKVGGTGSESSIPSASFLAVSSRVGPGS